MLASISSSRKEASIETESLVGASLLVTFACSQHLTIVERDSVEAVDYSQERLLPLELEAIDYSQEFQNPLYNESTTKFWLTFRY